MLCSCVQCACKYYKRHFSELLAVVLHVLQVRDGTTDAVVKHLTHAAMSMFDHMPHLARTKLRDCNNHADAVHSHLGKRSELPSDADHKTPKVTRHLMTRVEQHLQNCKFNTSVLQLQPCTSFATQG